MDSKSAPSRESPFRRPYVWCFSTYFAEGFPYSIIRAVSSVFFRDMRVTLESIARFGEGEMPREAMKRSLVEEIRQVLDACVRYHLERELKSARFVREILVSAAR